MPGKTYFTTALMSVIVGMFLIVFVASCGSADSELMGEQNLQGIDQQMGHDVSPEELHTDSPALAPAPFLRANEKPRSSITLPNRRLTDAERQEWIADYRALGGPTDNEIEITRLVNIERRNYGLVEVELDDGLMMAARFFAQQAYDLRGLYTGSHNFGPYADMPGEGWYPWGASFNIAEAFGARLMWSGGNWASRGDITAEVLVDGWMNSPGHRSLILFPDHRFIGAGQFPGGISYLFLSDRASVD